MRQQRREDYSNAPPIRSWIRRGAVMIKSLRKARIVLVPPLSRQMSGSIVSMISATRSSARAAWSLVLPVPLRVPLVLREPEAEERPPPP